MSTTHTLEERLHTLEQEVEHLRARQDQLTPNAFSLNSTGQIEEKLTGHLEASGIELPLAVGAFTIPTSLIQWNRTSNGAVIASLSAYGLDFPFKAEGLQIHVDSEAGYGSTIELSVQEREVLGRAEMFLRSNAINSQSGLSTSVFNAEGTEGYSAKILDAENHSDFLRLTGAASLFLAWGTHSFAFTATTNPEVSIEHGLGKIPSFAAAVLLDNSIDFSGWVFNGLNSRDETQVTFEWEADLALEPRPEAGTLEFCWIAIG
jgi:hypothetical protein